MALQLIILLALVQGITEFLPISSSGHLILVHEYFGSGALTRNPKDVLIMDIAVHVGTLFSVLLYYRKDVFEMISGGIEILRGDFFGSKSKTLRYVILGSIPVIFAGFVIHFFELFETRSTEIVAWTTILFGILLWIADDFSPSRKTIETLSVKSCLFVGLAQVLALIPGTSRSGLTMTAGRFLGLNRTEAARFSLLLAIVAIAGAGTLGTISLIKDGSAALTYDAFVAGVLAFISGYAAIALMIKWLERASFRIFAIYRIILGVILLWLIYAPTLA